MPKIFELLMKMKAMIYLYNYSKNIKIGYYRPSKYTKDDGKFGLNAIQNVLIIGIRNKKFEEK
jgi:hypothetical protein